MKKVRHLLCICYASVIQLAYIALNYVKTVKKKKYILLDLDYHNICRNLLPLMRWSREVCSKRRQNAFK